MPYWAKPPTAFAKQQVYDGTNWVNQAGDSEGRIKTIPHSETYDLGTFTAAGTGSSTDTVTGFEKWTWQVISDSSATAHDVRLQGSIDNSNWFDLDQSNTTGNEMRHVVNKPVRYIRANVVDMGDATSISVKVFGFR